MSTVDRPVPVLLVDDVPANLLALEAVLATQGIDVLKASCGNEALELLLQHDVALALLDVQMPEMNGFELAELMRGAERTRHVPIIFVTAGGSDLERRFRGYEAGAVDFISKPIEPTVLQGKVRVFLDLYRQRQQIAAQRDDLASAAAALQQADRAKDHFLAVLAHELRNPLAALKSGLNLLGKPRGQQQAETIRSEMDRMLGHLSRLVDDLLDISRITEGKVILQLERVRLDDVVQSAIAGSRHRFEEAGHEFCVTMPDQHVWLEADHTRLAQVLANLLGNAAKYTRAPGVIRLDCDVEDNEVVLRVQDTGIGIPVEMQKHIFEVFAQIDAHREHSQGGLGIGLALVRKLVSLHGGNIEVASEGIDKGSTFTVRLPLSGKDDRLSPRS